VYRPHATFVEPQTAPLLIAVAVFLHSARKPPAVKALLRTVRAHFWYAPAVAPGPPVKLAQGQALSVAARKLTSAC
jgi:hypothetical protein